MKLKERLNRFLDEIEEEIKESETAEKSESSGETNQPSPFQQELAKEINSVKMESSFVNIDLQAEKEEKKLGHVSVIDYDVKVYGNVSTSESLTINGIVIGNISCGKHLEVNGDIQGDIKCGSINICKSVIQGNISCDHDVIVDSQSEIHGDCWNENFVLAGFIQGNIYSRGRIHLKSSAEVHGNVSGCNIVIEDGAAIQGNIKIKRS